MGSLIYMIISRPDLSYAVGLVSQFMQLPRKPHLDAVKRILSKKQPTVALATSTEAEYRGAANAAYEVALLEMLLQDLEMQVQDAIVIYHDNLNSIQLAWNPVFHARTKHIEVHYHFIRERVLDGDIDLAYIGTEDQVADLFTKALSVEKLRRFRGMLGLWDMALSLRGSVEISSSMPT
ncbi:hypothetical protein L7F22_006057 [Adiantum nelumboides]|nr:hypothetical protein [Adiantum nelumboides]